MFDLQKFGIIYLLIAIVAVLFVATKLFPNAKMTDFANLNLRSYIPTNATPSAKLNTFAENVIVTITVGGQQQNYTVGASNAYLALVEAAKKENKTVKSQQSSSGVLVESVGGFGSGTDVWTFKVNGDSVNESPDKVTLKPGDKVEWMLISN